MKQEQWDIIKKCAKGQPIDPLPISLIIDSPWMPGYLDISMIDYYTMPDVWLEANLKVENDFPEIIFIPGFWAEIGMCAEPSSFGCRTSFFHDRTPLVHELLPSIDEVDRLVQPNPHEDGLMPLILNFYQRMEPRVNDVGQLIKVVAARGPMATASHIMGVTNFLMGMKEQPAKVHQILKMTTKLVKDWLDAQSQALSSVEGIMILDDLVGFIGPDDYLEFGHPYFSELFGAFPDVIKFFHNDMDNPTSFKYLRDWPVDIFNFSHNIEIAKVRELVGPNICLMGNVAPLDVLVYGGPEDVRDAARACIQNHPQTGLLLSAGGGTSPGTPGENIRALIDAARNRP
jgi:uroporphyrinogen-III decarboxylase